MRHTAFLIATILISFLFLNGNEEVAVETSPSINYRLRASDVIQVHVFQEPDLSKEVRIEADGTVLLPLIQRVAIGGKTVTEAQILIRDLYDRDYLVNPQVSVMITYYSPRQVDVLGQVNQPGPVEIPFDRSLSLLEAISRAKGFTRLARTSSVQVTRMEEGDRKQVLTINADKMMNQSDAEAFVLQDGDSIFVPERLL
jgi:polysaccharide biosynthesis/export protein